MRKPLFPLLLALLAASAVAAARTDGEGPVREEAPPIHSFAQSNSLSDAERAVGEGIYRAHCAACHEGGAGKAPHREFLEQMSARAILHALTDGVMRHQGSALGTTERRQVTEFLSGISLAAGMPAPAPPPPACDPANGFALTRAPAQAGWGYDNRRFVPAAAAGLSSDEIPRLKLAWAFAFPGALRARSQPVVAMNTVFVGSQDGTVYAFDLDTGCARWTSKLSAEVRTAIVVEPWREGARPGRDPRLFFGDLLGRVHALDALTGKELWSVRPVDHANATITGTAALHGDTLYVPVSSLEVVTAADPAYPCCTFRGAVVALDIDTGAEKWRHYTVDAEPGEHGRTPAGAPILAPSGAPVWNSPTFDAPRGQLYFGSGENYTRPADGNSDAVFAVDAATGQRLWRHQAVEDDAFNAACLLPDHPNCAWGTGPDYDISASVLLVEIGHGQQVLVSASKSGDVFALDPDTGQRAWHRKVGRGSVQGGVHFGMAAEGARIYVPIVDSALTADGTYTREAGFPGLYALDAGTGKVLWTHPAEEDRCKGRQYCDSGISAAVTAIPGAVLAGHLDGWLRAYDGATGKLLWETDTTVPVKGVNGEMARGGSMSGPGAAVAAGHVIVNSGYGFSHHMPGNALLVFSIDGK